MSWATDEWKDGLPGRALIKIREIETKLEKLTKEHKQKQFQLEQLEASYQKQIRKTEEEKSLQGTLKHENAALAESCVKLERNREKLAHELHNKEAYITSIEGQLSHAKQALEVESNRNTGLKNELERSQMEHNATLKKIEKLGEEHGKLQEHTNQQKSQLDAQEDKLKFLQQECSSMRQKLDGQNSRSPSVASSQVSTTSAGDNSDLKQQLNREIAERRKIEEEMQDLKLTMTKNSSGTSINNVNASRHPPAVDYNCSMVTKPTDSSMMNQNRMNFEDTERRVAKKQDELNQTITKLDQANLKVVDLEKKLKHVAEELGCQRHNAEAARQSQEQKFKQKEKEHNLEIAQQIQAFKSLDQQLQETKNKLQQEVNKIGNERNILQAQLEKTQHQDIKMEKEIKELREKNNGVQQSINAHEKTVDDLNKTISVLKKEKENLGLKFDGEHKKVIDLENQLKQVRSELQQSESANGDLRGKMMDKDLERETLEKKCEARVKELNNMMENLKLQLKDIQTKHSAVKDLAQKREHEVDQLTNKFATAEEERQKLKQQILTSQKDVTDLKAENNALKQQSKDATLLMEKTKEKCDGLERKVVEKDDSIREHQGELDKRKSEINALNAKIKEADTKAENFKQMVASKETEIDKVKKDMVDFQQNMQSTVDKERQKVKDVELALEKSQTRSSQLEQDVAKEKSNVAALEEEAANLTEQLNDARGSMLAKFEEVEEKEMQLLGIKEKMETTVVDLEKQLKEMEKEKVHITEQSDKLLAAKSEELEAGIKHVTDLKNKCEKSSEQLKFVEEKNTKLQEHLDEYKHKYKEVAMERDKQGEALKEKTKYISNIQNDLEKSSEHVKFVKEKCSKLEKCRNEYKCKYDESVTEKDKQGDALKVLEEELSKLQATTKQNNQQMESALENLRKEKSTLERDYRKACELADTKASETTDLLNKLEESEAKVDKLRHRVDITEEELVTAKAHARDAKNCEKELSIKLSSSLEELAEATELLKRTKKEAAENEQQLQSVIVTLNEKHSSLEIEFHTTQNTLATIQEKLTQKEEELKEFRKAFDDLLVQSKENQERLDVKNSEIAIRSAEVSKLQEKFDKTVDDLNATILQLEKSNIKITNQLEGSASIIEKKEAEVQMMMEELESTTKAASMSQTRCEELETDMKKLQGELCILQVQVEEGKELLEVKHSEIEMRDQEMGKLQENFDKTVLDLNSMIHQLEESRAKISEQLEHSTATVEKKEAEIQMMIEEIEDANEAASKSQNKYVELETDLKKLQGELCILQGQVEEGKKLMEVKHSEIEMRDQEIGKLQEKFDKMVLDLNSKIQQLEESSAKISEQLEHSTATVEKKEAEIQMMIEEIEDANEAASESQNKYAGLVTDLKKLQGELCILQGQVEEGKKLMEVKHSEIEMRDQEIGKLQEKFDKMVLDLNSKIQHHEESSAKISEQLENSIATVEKKEAEIQMMIEEIKDANEAVSESQNKYAGLETDLKKLQGELSILQGQLEDGNKLLDAKLSVIEMRDQEISKLQEKFDRTVLDLNSMIQQLEESSAKISEQLEHSTATVEKKEAEIQMMIEEIKDANEAASKSQNKYVELETDLKKLQGELYTLQGQVEEGKKLLEVKHSEIEMRDQEIGKLQEKFDKMVLDLNSKIQQLEESSAKISEQLEHSTATVEKKEAEIHMMIEEIKYANEAASKSQNRYAELETDWKKLQGELCTLQGQVEEGEKLLEVKHSEIVMRDLEMGKLQENIDKTILDLNIKIQQLEESSAKISEQLEHSTATVEKKEAEIQIMIEEIKNANEATSKSKNKYADLETDLKKFQEELCILQGQVEEGKKLLEVKHSEIEMRDLEMGKLQEKFDKTVLDLNSKIQHHEESSAKISEQLEHSSATVKKKEAEIQMMIEEIKDANEAAFESQNKYAGLENDLKKLQGELSILQGQVEDGNKLLDVKLSVIEMRDEEISKLQRHFDQTVVDLNSKIQQGEESSAKIGEKLEHSAVTLEKKEAELHVMMAEMKDTTDAACKSQNRCEELQIQLKNLQGDLCVLQEQVEEGKKLLKSKTESLEETLGDLTSLQTHFDATVAQLNGTIAGLEESNAKISEQIEHSTAMVEKKEVEVEMMIEEIKKVNEVAAESQSWCQEMEMGRNKLQKELNTAKEQLKEGQELLKSKDLSFEKTCSELNTLQSLFDSTVAQLNATVTELEMDKCKLSEEFQQAVETINTKKVHAQSLKDEIGQLQDEFSPQVASLNTEVTKLTEELHNANLKLEKTQDLLNIKELDLRQQKDNYDTLKEEHKQMQTCFSILQVNVDDKESCIGAFEQQIQQMKESINAFETSIQEKESTLQTVKTLLQAAEKELDDTKQKYEDMRLEFRQLHEKFVSQEGVLDTLRGELKHGENGVFKLTEQSSTLSAEVDAHIKIIHLKDDEINRLQNQLENKDKVLLTMKKDLDDQINEVGELEDQCSQLDNKMKLHMVEMEDTKQCVATLMEQVDILQKSLQQSKEESAEVVGRLTKEANALRSNLQVSHMDIEDRDQRIQKDETKMEQLLQQIQQQSLKIKHIESDLEKVEKEKLELIKQKDAFEEELSLVQKTDAEQEVKLESLVAELKSKTSVFMEENADASKKMKDMEFALSNNEEEVEAIANKFNQLNVKYEQLTQNRDELNMAYKDLQQELDAVINQKDEFAKEKQQLSNDLEESNATQQEIIYKLEQLQQQSDQQNIKISSLVSNLETLEKEKADIGEQKNSLEEQLSRSKKEIEENQGKLNGLVAELRVKITCLEEEKAGAFNNIQNMEFALANSTKDLECVNQQFSELKVKYEQATQYGDEQNCAMVNLQKQYDEIVSKNDELAQEHQQLSNYIDVVKEEEKCKLTENQELKINQQEKSLVKLGNKVCDLEMTLAEKDKEIQAMQSNLDATEEQLNSSQKAIKYQIREKDCELSSFHDTICELRDVVNLKDVEIQKSKDLLNESSENIKTLEESHTKIKACLNEKIEHLDLELKKTRQSLVEHQHQTVTLEEQVEKLKTEADHSAEITARSHKEFEIQKTQLNDQVYKLKMEIAQSLEIITTKSEEVQKLTHDLQDATNVLASKDRLVSETESMLTTESERQKDIVQQLETTIAIKDQTIERLDKQVQELEASRASENSIHVEAEAEFKCRETELNKQLSAMEAKVEELQKLLAFKSEEMERLAQELNDASQFLVHRETEASEAESCIQKIKLELEALNSEKSDTEKMLQSKHEELMRLQVSFKQDAEIQEQKVIEMETQMACVQEKTVKQHEKEVAKFESRIEVLESQLSDKGMVVETLQCEKTELGTSLETSKENASKKQVELDSLNDDNLEAKRALQAKHEELMRLQVSLEEDAEMHERKVLELEEQVAKNKKEILQKHAEEVSKLESQIASLESRLSDKEMVTETLQGEKAELNEALKTKEENVKQAQADALKQKDTITNLKSECQQLQLSTEKANQSIKSMSAKLKRAQQEPSPNAKHQQELKRAEAVSTKLRGQLAEEKSTRATIQEQFDKLKVAAAAEPTKRRSGHNGDAKKWQSEKTELEKDKESLMGKLQFSMNNSRRLEQDLSKLQYYVIDLEAKVKTLESPAPESDEDPSSDSSMTKEDLKKVLEERIKSDEDMLRQCASLKKEVKALEKTNRNLKGKLTMAAIKIKEYANAGKEVAATSDGIDTNAVSAVNNVLQVAASKLSKSPVLPVDKPVSSAVKNNGLVDSSQNDFKISRGAKRALSTPSKGITDSKRSKPIASDEKQTSAFVSKAPRKLEAPAVEQRSAGPTTSTSQVSSMRLKRSSVTTRGRQTNLSLSRKFNNASESKLPACQPQTTTTAKAQMIDNNSSDTVEHTTAPVAVQAPNAVPSAFVSVPGNRGLQTSLSKLRRVTRSTVVNAGKDSSANEPVSVDQTSEAPAKRRTRSTGRDNSTSTNSAVTEPVADVEMAPSAGSKPATTARGRQTGLSLPRRVTRSHQVPQQKPPATTSSVAEEQQEENPALESITNSPRKRSLLSRKTRQRDQAVKPKPDAQGAPTGEGQSLDEFQKQNCEIQ